MSITTGEELDRSLWAFPGIRKVTCTTKVLKQFLLNNSFPMLLQGRAWNVKSKNLGAGVKQVWLEEAQ